MSTYHISVLLKESIEELKVKKGGRYIDTTLGGGGHTKKLLEKGGVILGIDHDEDAIEFVRAENANFVQNGQLILARGNFKDIEAIAHSKGFNSVAGILFDLGVSSYQLDTAERGFSFQKTGPLDMRMDRSLGVTAADLLKVLSKGELYELFSSLGEERFARAISDRIVRARGIEPITTTKELADLIRHVYGRSKEGIDPATKTFQALRIVVNDELHNIQYALPKAIDLLEKSGRLVVISFHSLEDKIVKKTFLEFEEKNLGKMVYKKPITPTENEISQNNRSRSAKMRAFEKI